MAYRRRPLARGYGIDRATARAALYDALVSRGCPPTEAERLIADLESTFAASPLPPLPGQMPAPEPL
jgi:hypothetical protein